MDHWGIESHFADKIEKYEKFLMHLYVTTPHAWLVKEIEELLNLTPRKPNA